MTAHPYRILLDDGPADGNGDGTPEKAVATVATPKEEGKAPPTLDDMRRKIEERGVDQAAKMLLELTEDNYKFRSRIRDFEGRVPEGAVVLKGDDAKAWEQYRTLGRPSDLAKLREERDAYKGSLDGIARERTLAEAAGLHGWKPPVLTRFAKADGLEVVVDDSGEKDKDGKAVRKAYVVTRGDDGQEVEGSRVPLDRYAEEHWRGELDALREPPARPKAADRPDPMRPQGAGGGDPAADRARRFARF